MDIREKFTPSGSAKAPQKGTTDAPQRPNFRSSGTLFLADLRFFHFKFNLLSFCGSHDSLTTLSPSWREDCLVLLCCTFVEAERWRFL